MARSQSQAKQDDDSSIDELAGSALLDNVPHGPIRLPSLHSLAAMTTEDILHPRSSKTTAENLDKPLPPIPRKDPFVEQRQHWQGRPALTIKSTNMRASGTGEKRGARPEISPPKLHDSVTGITAASPSRPTTSHTFQSALGTQTSTADAANLSSKISNLMERAAAQESGTKRKAAAYTAESAKLSPLERSRKALVKATRAIKERLSNNSNLEKSVNPKRAASSRRSLSIDSEPEAPPQYESQEELHRVRIDRRIAEGENLSNPKIRQLMGDGHIPRKPLPVYESMKSSSDSSLSRNPFSDGKEQNESRQSPEDYSGFNFDFSKHKHKGKISRASPPATDQMDTVMPDSRKMDLHLAVPQPTSRFSNMISGLAQHSDTEFFSSSPVGYSTPRIRLEPPQISNAPTTPAGALVRSHSILEFSFEAQSEDAMSQASSPQTEAPEEPPIHKIRASGEASSPETRMSERSLSVKRKGATEDLRSQAAPATKKVKMESTSSKDEGGLAAGISLLGTGSERVPLSPKSTNIRPAPSRNASMRRGLSIFDISKGKGLEEKDEDVVKRPWTRTSASKRSSMPGSGSVLFSRGRESRAGMQRLGPIDGDHMDVDELQMD